MAYERRQVDLQAEIFVRLDINRLPAWVGLSLSDDTESLIVKTSVGRLIFNEALPVELRDIQIADGQWELGTLMNKKAGGY